MSLSILLAGSTGLIGNLVSGRLPARSGVDLIRLVRQGSPANGSAIDFEQLCAAPEATLKGHAPAGADVAISCLGTTIRTAGSQAAMLRVDRDYVLAFAKGARALGARQFILVSSAGAGGPGFYLQTKGAAEDAVRNLGFDRVDLIRPGFLLGQRAERRVWEAIGQRLFAWLSPVLVGSLSRYGAIGADTVADAIVALAGREGAGVYVHHNADLRHIGRHSAPS
jgi:uncharacterized protein YbjT (DUF2867 family)